jgi:nitrous oxide reductase accessory protein NosL
VIWFYVIDKKRNGLGWGVAHACFETKAEAMRYQLESGKRNTTEIEVI